MWQRVLNVIILLITTIACAYFPVCPAGHADMVAQAQSSPDLTVEAIASSPETPAINDKVTFTVTLSNQGTAISGPCYAAYYIDDAYLGKDYVSPIEPGASAGHMFSWTAQAGSHTVKAVVDYQNQVSEINEDNNSKTYTFSTLGPDLVIDSIIWSPLEPSVGSTVTFTITIKNLGALFAKASRIQFYIDGVSRGYQDTSRINAGATLSRTFSWVAKAGTHNVRAIVDDTNTVPEMDENNNEETALLSILLPDLIIDNITWAPAEPSVGDNVSFIVTVANQGSGVASNTTVHFYVNENYIDSGLTSVLNPNATENLTFSWIAGFVPRSIKAVISTVGTTTESDYTNNEKTCLFTPQLSDLIIQDITWAPANPAVGANTTFSVTILNQGNGKSSESGVDLLVDNGKIDYRGLAPIDAGEIRTVTFIWITQGGVHKIRAIVDPQNNVHESLKTNNDKTITFPTLPPDLIIEQITWMPLAPAIGDTVTVTVRVKNQGEANSGYTYIIYYIDNIQLTTGQVNPISSNATDNQSFTWTLTPGEHVIKASVDPTNIVDEADETNNEGFVTMVPSGPDLIIESIGWSRSDPQVGEMVTFSVTVQNNGDVTSGASIVHLYAGNDSRGYQSIPELAPGTEATRTFDWKVLPGRYDIRATADDANLVVEINEQNNEMVIAYPAPDLTIDILTWSPEKPVMGDKITLTAHVQNIGSLRSEASQLHFYVDANVAERRDTPPLDAGTGATETFEWEATNGPHVLSVLADGDRAVLEGVENNNEGTASFSVLAPDLIIESIAWPAGEPPTGDNVTFKVTIRNQGDAESGYAYVGYYVDGDYLTSEQIKSLKSKAKTETLFSTLMSQTGPHTISVVIDEGNKVPESDETNNEESVSITTESVASPPNTNKPAPLPLTPSTVPQAPEKKGHNWLIFFGAVILIFSATLIFSMYREFRRRNE